MRKAFIGSTSLDLTDYRLAARDVCLNVGIYPHMMEYWQATSAGATEGSKGKIDKLDPANGDFYIGIFAFRYGYIEDGYDRSVTEIEFDYAGERSLDRLCFLARREDWPEDLIDPENLDRQKAFRARIDSTLIRSQFSNVDNFKFALLSALQQNGYIEEGARPIYTPPDPPPPGQLPEPVEWVPPGSRIDFARNAVFTGREDDLLQLAERLVYSPDGAAAITGRAATVGIGGLGKTQLAVEFCYRYGRFFKGVHWLQAPVEADVDAHERLRAEIAACGVAMNLPDWPKEEEAQVKLTLDAWQRSGPRLVVLDNLEDPEVLRSWLPRLSSVRLLLTARNTKWPPHLGLHVQQLDALEPVEARDLLRRLAPRLEDAPDDDLDAIGQRFGRLPLALDLAGRYLADRETLSVAGYLAELDAAANDLAHTALLDWVESGSPTAHELNLTATYDLSWNRLDADNSTDALAGRVFRAAGYCAPNAAIPRELLLGAVGPDEEAPAFEARFDKALRRLQELGLLSRREGGLVIHPLLGQFAQLRDKEADDSPLPVVANVMATLSNEANETGLPAEFYPLRPHLEHLAPLTEAAGQEKAGTLWNNYGYHLKMVSELAGAKAAYERALRIDEAAYGPDHPEVAIRVNNLGSVLQDMGQYEQAKAAYERALRIDEAAYGPDHPKVAIRVNNLGGVYRQLGQYEQAKTAYERVLEILDESDPNYGAAVSNLGGVYRQLGQYAQAREAYERALHIVEQHLGENHPKVATLVNNLGTVLKDMGQYAQAREAFERALRIDEAAYGPDHPKVAIRINNLGGLFYHMGDLGKARAAFERALRINEKHLGENHPNVATLVNNLGEVYQQLGQYEQAKEAFERALLLLKKPLGENPLYVASTYSNLGLLLYKMGDSEGAIRYMERAVRIFEAILPPGHPDTENAKRGLAIFYQERDN